MRVLYVTSVPLVIAALTMMLTTKMPRLLMFYAHKPALDRWAQQTVNSPNPPIAARVGLYEFRDIGKPRGMPSSSLRCYITKSQGFMCEGGLIYNPSSRPTNESCETYTPASGAWYFLSNDN